MVQRSHEDAIAAPPLAAKAFGARSRIRFMVFNYEILELNSPHEGTKWCVGFGAYSHMFGFGI